MTVSELIGELQNIGVRLWEEDGLLRYRAPSQVMTEDRLARLREHKPAVLEELRRAAAGVTLTADPAARHEPFPLTDVQSSYLLGRSGAYEYGGVGCQAYLEVRFPAFDPHRVAEAWRLLVARHDALRTIVHPDGYQQVLADVPDLPVEIADLRDASEAARQQVVDRVRADLSARDYRPDQWPLHDLRVTRTDQDLLVQLSIDLLICDYASVQLLLGELEQLCLRPDDTLPDLTVCYRDYLTAEQGLRENRSERDRAYWWSRLEADTPAELAPAPALPVRAANAADTADVARPAARFERLQARLDRDDWQNLRRRAAAHNVTPTVAGVKYVDIETRDDEVVTPYTNALDRKSTRLNSSHRP